MGEKGNEIFPQFNVSVKNWKDLHLSRHRKTYSEPSPPATACQLHDDAAGPQQARGRAIFLKLPKLR
jgi:hypothetical protein